MSKQNLIDFYETNIRDDKKLGEWDELADEDDYKLYARFKGTSIEKSNFACRVQLIIRKPTTIQNILKSLIHP